MQAKSLADRLQLKGQRRIAVLSEESGGGLAEVAALGPRAPVSEADIVLAFAGDKARLVAALEDIAEGISPAASVWIAYPKLTSRLRGDLSRDVIHVVAPTLGWTTVAQVAIDDDWSAMRLKRATGQR